MPRIAAYATLKQRHVREKAIGRNVPIEAQGIILGYRESFVHEDGDTWPTLLSAASSHVPVEVLRLTSKQLDKLDHWESRYQRRPVTVHVYGEKPRAVDAYFYVGEEKD